MRAMVILNFKQD